MTALKRMHARAVYDGVTRGYEAARKDRLNKSWNAPNLSADRELDVDADVARGRARSLVRDNAYAKGVVRAAVRNIVGTGIKPQARVELADGESHETFNAKIEALWDRWQRQADITGQRSFYEIQQQVVQERWEAGELLIRFVENTDKNAVLPFALELIDCDRLASDERYPAQHAVSGNEVRRGVEINRNGKPVAYWLYEYHPSDLNTLRTTPKRYPAEDFLHLFRPNRIGQTRGMTEFAPIVRWCKNLDRYMDNELTSSTIASCFSVAIKTISAGGDGGILNGASTDDGVDENSNAFEYIEPGLVARLFPDEEVQVIDPNRNQSNATGWIDLMLRSMGVGTGLSYERLTRDYSKTNYSSNRASDLEDRREFRMEQQWLITHLCIPVWTRFMSHALRKRDMLGFMPTAMEFLTDFDNWMRHDWNAPGWEWVDPKKEVDATVVALENNLTTLAEENQRRDGGDWRSRVKQRQLEKQLIADGEPEEPQQSPSEPQAGSEPVMEDKSEDMERAWEDRFSEWEEVYD